MQNEPDNQQQSKMECEEVRDLLYLYACDELERGERLQLEAHLETCPACQEAAAEHNVLKQKLPGGFVNRKLFYYSRDN